MRRRRPGARGQVPQETISGTTSAPPRRTARASCVAATGSSAAPQAAGGDAEASSQSAVEEELDLSDLDFDSSDVDAALMSVGQPQEGRSAHTTQLWAQRSSRKRRLARAKKFGATEIEDEQPRSKRLRGSSTPALNRLNEDVRDLLAKGQAAFAMGRFEEAVQAMHEVVRLQPGLPDPYHVLVLVYQELGQRKKALDAMLLAAYFTAGTAEARRLWRRVAGLSQEQGLIDQAIYAYKRSLPRKEERHVAEDLESEWQLAQNYFARGSVDSGIRVLLYLYEHTGDENVAKEAALKLFARHRWRECLGLLERCVEKGRRSQPPRVDLNILNMYCEVLLELRDFSRCAKVIIELLHLGEHAAPSGQADSKPVVARLHASPLDLVAKLATARLQLREHGDEDLLANAAIEVVLTRDPGSNQDLFLSIVDALLADDNASAAAAAGQRWPRRSSVSSTSAAQALEILERMEESGTIEDLRERRAMCLWQVGRVEEAALLLEATLEDPTGRPESELREIRVRAAEAWIELGEQERADSCLSSLSYEDLQRSNVLPGALGSEQRRKAYRELSEVLEVCDGLPPNSPNWPPLEELQRFVARFRHLVYDCELDYARLTSLTAAVSVSSKTAAAAESGTGAHPDGAAPDCDAGPATADKAGADNANAHAQTGPTSKEDGADSAALPGSIEKLAETAADTSASGADAVVPVSRSPATQARIVNFASNQKRLKAYEMGPLVVPSVFFKTKRRHLGLETLEDAFGFEAYLSFVLRGVHLIRQLAFGGVGGPAIPSIGMLTELDREKLVNVTQAVELCEMILSNRRLVSMRNPVKRRMMRSLAVRSVSLAFEARLWRVVFKHLRGMCEAEEEGQEGALALFTRLLFSHEEAALASGRQAREPEDGSTVWEKFQPFSSTRPNTYASSVSDVRGWAIRKLIRNPRSFGFTLVVGHFCVVASQYQMALAEYWRAHRLAPFDALTALCVGTAYLSLSMSRTVLHRHDMVLKALAFLQRYARLRLGLEPGALRAEPRLTVAPSPPGEPPPQEATETVAPERVTTGAASVENKYPLDLLARRAEALYNLGRGFQQIGIFDLAYKQYKDALLLLEKQDALDSRFESFAASGVAEVAPPLHERVDLCVVRRSCAYNLAMMLRAQGSVDEAWEILQRHIVF